MKKLLFTALVIAMTASRTFGSSYGIDNHNPGNLVKSASLWEGQVKCSGRFIKFQDAYYGLRALGIVLVRYEQRHGINTIEQLVARFAPQHENDVHKYVSFLSEYLGVSSDEYLSISNMLDEIIPAIIIFENGQQPYSEEQIRKAIEAARKHCEEV